MKFNNILLIVLSLVLFAILLIFMMAQVKQPELLTSNKFPGDSIAIKLIKLSYPLSASFVIIKSFNKPQFLKRICSIFLGLQE